MNMPNSRDWLFGIVCTSIAGAWAVFWLVAILSGAFPGSFRSYAGVCGFAGLSIGFRRLKGTNSVVVPFMLWPCVPLALGIVSEAREHHQLDALAIAAFVTCIGLVAAAHVLQWRQKDNLPTDEVPRSTRGA